MLPDNFFDTLNESIDVETMLTMLAPFVMILGLLVAFNGFKWIKAIFVLATTVIGVCVGYGLTYVSQKFDVELPIPYAEIIITLIVGLIFLLIALKNFRVMEFFIIMVCLGQVAALFVTEFNLDSAFENEMLPVIVTVIAVIIVSIIVCKLLDYVYIAVTSSAGMLTAGMALSILLPGATFETTNIIIGTSIVLSVFAMIKQYKHHQKDE